MRILVTYQTKTGFTKKYAEWIAQALACELSEISKVSPADVQSCDLVIHGGWLMGGMVSGLDKVKRLCPRKLMVFGVGLTVKEQLDVAQCRAANKLGDTPFFYYEGGIDPKNMGFMGRMMVKAVTKKTPEYTDLTDKNEIKPLVELALSEAAS